MPTITAEQRSDLVLLVNGLFGAAPTSRILSNLVKLVEEGSTVDQVASMFSANTNFESIYAPALLTSEFATKFTTNLLGSAATTETTARAEALVTTYLNAGDSRTEAAWKVTKMLSETADADFAAAKAQLNNKADVSLSFALDTQYTELMTLSQLQTVISSVTSDAATVTAAKAAVAAGTAVSGTSTGQTFSLTTGTDVLSGTNGNDTFVGVSDDVTSITVNQGQPVTETFGGLDSLDGGAGKDTLVLTNSAGTMNLDTSVTVKNIETLQLTSADDDVTADVSNWTGLTSVVVDNRDAAEGTVVTTKANATSVSVKGGTTAANATTTTITDSATGTTKDTLASVSVDNVVGTGTLAISSDALTSLNVSNNATNNTIAVTAAAGTRELTLGLNKVTDGAIQDNTATTVNVAATGANSSNVDLSATSAKAINFSGDKTVSIDIGNAAAQAANLVITSTNSAGVTLATNALDTDVTFTGGAGKDTVTVGATTKTIDMGAGDDTVVATAALGTGGKLVGGEGTDTLSMTAAVAQTLSDTATFEGVVDGFEKVALGQVAANTSNTVNLANLDDISYVTSAGTAAGGTAEQSTFTFPTLSAGTSITVAGRTVTATSGDATPTQVATAFASGTSAGTLTVSGALSGVTAAAVSGQATQVQFTATANGDQTPNLSATTTAVTAPSAPSVSTTNGTGSSNETAEVTFVDLAIGQSVTVAGLTITAETGSATAAQVAAAVAGGSAGTLAVTGTTANWSAAAAAGSSVTYTSTTANTDVANISVSSAGSVAPTVNAPVVTNGTAGASLTVTNMANNGTFELTDVVGGSATVQMKDATGTADVLNVKLNGAANIVNTGTLTVAGVETINIEATDSSADTVTLTNPAAASTVNLNAAAATTINVSGNHGVDFSGSTLTNVTTLDASGVVATGATSSATAAQIGTAGAVTFTSAVTNKAVTVTTGNGDDVINVGSVNDATFLATKVTAATVTTGEGNDTVTGSAGMDIINTGAGNDTVNSSAGTDTITFGAGNDEYNLTAASHSVLAAYDTITDFSANTYGAGANGAVTTAGANGVASTSLTGDVIDLTAVMNNAVSTINVYVASNAANAQTFIQNVANASTSDSGIALDSSTGLLYIDLDSNGVVDSVIALTGVTTIDAAAFTF
mgnify:CR=1 FL=1